MTGRYFDEFKVGEKFFTGRRTLLESDLTAFCNLVWFNSSMFFDHVYAKEEMPYGSPVFPGPFIIPLAVGLFLKLGLYEKTIIALLGIQNMKFKAPLRANDTMQVEVEILDQRPSKSNPDTGILTVKFTIFKVLSPTEKEFIMEFEMAHLLKRNTEKIK